MSARGDTCQRQLKSDPLAPRGQISRAVDNTVLTVVHDQKGNSGGSNNLEGTRRMSPETGDEIASFQGLAGEIVEVTGRLAEGGQAGLPAIERITLRLDADGTELEFGIPSSGPHSPLDLVAPIFAQSFARVDRAGGRWSPVCPICLTEGPLTDDHVPQGPLGGSEMTMTCEPCNNLLGSRIESELQDWFDHVLVGLRFAHEDVPGPRRAPRVLYREGPNGLGLLLDDPGPRELVGVGGNGSTASRSQTHGGVLVAHPRGRPEHGVSLARSRLDQHDEPLPALPRNGG